MQIGMRHRPLGDNQQRVLLTAATAGETRTVVMKATSRKHATRVVHLRKRHTFWAFIPLENLFEYDHRVYWG